MRGRLIFAFWAELARLDARASTYDRVLKETSPTPPGRAEHPSIFVPAQIVPATWAALAMMASGNMPDAEILLTFHFEYLERHGLVDPGGIASIHQGDRLVSIREGGCVVPADAPAVMTVRNPPGLYVTKAVPAGLGIGLKRNLLDVTFDDRERAVRTGGA